MCNYYKSQVEKNEEMHKENKYKLRILKQYNILKEYAKDINYVYIKQFAANNKIDFSILTLENKPKNFN